MNRYRPRYRLPPKVPRPNPEEAASKELEAELANIERLKARGAELEKTIAKLKARLAANVKPAPVQSKYNWPTGEDKILFLPAGRCVRTNPPVMEFEVAEATATELNLHVAGLRRCDLEPWLDLSHDYKSRTFTISHFRYEPGAGIFCHGSFTQLGRQLRDAGRISGVSFTIPTTERDGKAYDGILDVELDASEVAQLKGRPVAEESFGVMGALLIDGAKTSIQRMKSRTEQWQEILAAMGRMGSSDASR